MWTPDVRQCIMNCATKTDQFRSSPSRLSSPKAPSVANSFSFFTFVWWSSSLTAVFSGGCVLGHEFLLAGVSSCCRHVDWLCCCVCQAHFSHCITVFLSLMGKG